MQLNTKKKKLPKLSTNRAAEKFVATADLTRYDLSGMVPVRFEFKPKTIAYRVPPLPNVPLNLNAIFEIVPPIFRFRRVSACP